LENQGEKRREGRQSLQTEFEEFWKGGEAGTQKKGSSNPSLPRVGNRPRRESVERLKRIRKNGVGVGRGAKNRRNVNRDHLL